MVEFAILIPLPRSIPRDAAQGLAPS